MWDCSVIPNVLKWGAKQTSSCYPLVSVEIKHRRQSVPSLSTTLTRRNRKRQLLYFYFQSSSDSVLASDHFFRIQPKRFSFNITIVLQIRTRINLSFHLWALSNHSFSVDWLVAGVVDMLWIIIFDIVDISCDVSFVFTQAEWYRYHDCRCTFAQMEI